MGMLNRIVNIAVLVLAIIAVIFGTLLFKKREELRKRGDKMAETINNVAKILDTNSGTKYADSLIYSRLELNSEKDPKAAENAKKSLYHNNYANLENVLVPFKKQSQDVIDQRNVLGTTLKNIATTLEIPETFGEDEFRDIATYNEKQNQLVSLIQKVNQRDNALVDQIANSAQVVGFTIDKETLKNLNDFRSPLDGFGSRVKALKNRSDNYETSIKRICGILEVTEPTLEGEDYPSALETAESAVQGVKDDFEQTKKDLDLTKEQLAEKTEQLNQSEAKVASLEEVKKNLQKRIDELLGPELGGEGPVKPLGEDQEQLVKKLEGNILEVNDKWDFVVINLGKSNKLAVGKNKDKKITVSLPLGSTLDVSRDNQYIAKIKVLRVNETCAIADVLYDLKNGKVQPGDKVFFASSK